MRSSRTTLGQVWLYGDQHHGDGAPEVGRIFEIKGQDGNRLDQIAKIFSFTEDTDGNIWAIGYDDPKHITHLLRIRDRRVQEDIQITSLVPHAHFLGADPAGGIWIGTGDGKLAHYQNGVANIVSNGRSGASPVMMFSFSVDSAGVLWGTTSEGLYRWDHGTLTIMDSHNGLPCSMITAALIDNSGSLWLDGNCGYLRISAADLAKWAARPEAQVTVTSLWRHLMEQTRDGMEIGSSRALQSHPMVDSGSLVYRPYK